MLVNTLVILVLYDYMHVNGNFIYVNGIVIHVKRYFRHIIDIFNYQNKLYKI